MRPAALLAGLGWALAAGCGGPAGPPAPGPAAPAGPPPPAWTLAVHPFPVTDSAGRILELAFLGGFNLPRPQLVDTDGDGDLDLVLQEVTGRLIELEHLGTGPDGLPRFRHKSWRYHGLDVGEWARFVDLDQDGDQDLLAELPYSYLRYLRNDGRAGQAAYRPVGDSLRDDAGRAIFADRQNIPQLGDIDCDGVPDLLIGRVTGVILHYALVQGGTGAPVFRLVTERFQDLEIITGQGSMHGANTMALADVDGDGDSDLVWGDFFEAGLLLFENDGTCQAPRLRSIPVRFPVEDPLVTSGYNAPAFGDLDGDGRPDLVVGVLGGAYDPLRTSIANLHYYSRDAEGRYLRRTSQLLPMIDVGSESMPALVDLDGDGDLDLLLANKIDPADRRTSRIYRFENTGTARRPVFRLAGALEFRGAYHYAPAFGDLDGDGDPDLLLGNYGASLAFWRNDGGGPVPRFTLVDSAFVTITRGSNTAPALGDLDGDGDLDLMVGEASGTLNYYRNDGTPTEPRFVLVSDQYDSLDVGRRSNPAFLDLDGDGDLDLLVGSEADGVLLFQNLGSAREPRFVPEGPLHPDLPPLTAPAVGDLDGDGVPELVVGNVGGGAVLLRRP